MDYKKIKQLKKDKRGVFGLTAIQAFFAVILGLGLLAYVIVIIMGVLSESTIISRVSGSVNNESTLVAVKESGTTLASTYDNAVCTISKCINATDGVTVPAANYTTSGCTVSYSGASAEGGFNNSIWKCDYTLTYYPIQTQQSKNILGNTSTGVTGFFSSINPIYAILAVLVIILVLVVLVRVVQAPNQQRETPQL